MNCGTQMIKYLLFLSNFVVALGAAGIIAVAALVKSGNIDKIAEHLSKDTIDKISTHTTLLIIVGVAVFVISFLGFCGAIQESYCMLITFAVMYFTLLVAEITFVYLLNEAIIDETPATSEIRKMYNKHKQLMLIVAITLGVFEILSVVLSCILANSINNENKRQYNVEFT